MNVQVRDTPAGATLGQRIKAAREAARYSRPQLATATGIPSKSIEKFEAGEQEPSVSRIIKLATTLGVSLDQLLGKTSPTNLPQQTPESDKAEIDIDPVEALLAELDELRAAAFRDSHRRAMALVDQLVDELRYLEPADLVKVAVDRDIDPGTCQSLDLQNAFAASIEQGQAACVEVEQRIIDTAILGNDLAGIDRTALAKLADQLKLESDGWGGWSADDEALVPTLRAGLRQLAYAGKGVDLSQVPDEAKRASGGFLRW